jgi:hypothetical protein
MTKTKATGPEPFASSAPWAAAGPMFEVGVKLTETFCTQAIEVASELTDFTMRRVQEDIRLPEQLARCRSPQDVQRAWLDYWKTAIAQYQAEWGRLADLQRGSHEVVKVGEKARLAA